MLSNYFVVPDTYVFPGSPEAVDVTSFDTLLIFSNSHVFDYQVFRQSLTTNLIPNWANLLYTDRMRCVQHYCYPTNISDDEFNGYFSATQMELNWDMVCVNTRATRLMRLFAAFQKISYMLTTMQVAVIYNTTKQMLVDYYYANLPSILFWIQNQAYPPLGLDFTSSGFQQQSGYSPQLEGMLLDILVNGNYTYTDTAQIVVM
jgi:hypothetical protein